MATLLMAGMGGKLSLGSSLAREFEADEDEKRWEERLKRVARAKPADKGPAT